MSRPTDWTPLNRLKDPVPGDPADVRGEAKYYGDVAERIEDQVARLRRISDQDGLKGDYAPELQKSCKDLGEHLEKAKGRFETTSEQLYKLAPAMETAQSGTKEALDDAIAAKEAQDAEDAEAENPPRYGSPMSEDQKSAVNKFDGVMDDWDRTAKSVADEIRDGADDDMKDGRFEAIKAWVKEHAKLLEKIADILGAIVLVLAIVIFIVSNPAGWLVGLALIAGGLLLLVDTLLAASGEGSWFDVGLDVLGLATLGMGSLAGKLAKFARAGSLFKGSKLAGLRGFASSLTSAFNSGGRLSRALSRVNPMTYVRAGREGLSQADDVARALSSLKVPNAFKASQLADDLADISKIISPANPLKIHSGAVGLAETMGTLGDRVTVAAFGTHSWIDAGGLGSLADDLTKFEIPTKTW